MQLKMVQLKKNKSFKQEHGKSFSATFIPLEKEMKSRKLKIPTIDETKKCRYSAYLYSYAQ